MKTQNALLKFIQWLPSLILLLFYLPNAINKILLKNQEGKIVSNKYVLIATGLFLLLAIILFLYNRTVLLGASLLALYMTLITCIHIYKGKPFEVALLIVIATLFAAYIRKPKIFSKNLYTNL